MSNMQIITVVALCLNIIHQTIQPNKFSATAGWTLALVYYLTGIIKGGI